MHFKPHIISSEPYRGGSTRDEIDSNSDRKIYKLSSNENPIGPSPRAIEAIRLNLNTLHEYRFENDSRLKAALVKYYNGALGDEQFITANSGLELIDMICRAFLDPGLECIISTPTFLAYKNFAELQGARVIDVPLDPVDFFLDVAKILEAVSKKTRVVFLSSPNNPTGAIIPKNAMDMLLSNLPQHVVVLYDEVYRHFASDKNYAMAQEYVALNKNIIGLNSFSKCYGLAGLRVAYAYTTAGITAYLNKLRRPFMINSLSTVAAIAALGDLAHVLATQKMIREQKHWLYNQLDKLQIHYWPGNGNFILLLPPYNNLEFTRDMMGEGIMVRPTEVFGLPECVRLSIGNHPANLAGIEAVQKLIAKKKANKDEQY
jgi:histidinol-phosphate aminotransferase